MPSTEPDHDELDLSLNDLALLYHGRIVHSLGSSSSPLEILKDHLLGVTSSGLISFLLPSSPALLERCLAKDGVEYIRPENRHAFLLPGFIDTHLHAPQYLFAGTALDVPLMEWLNKCVHELVQRKGRSLSESLCRYTFPSESRIDQDPHGLGKRVYETLAKRLIEQGTTMAALYGTIGVEAK